MLSERMLRHIDRLLDEADRAMGERDWAALPILDSGLVACVPGNSEGT